MKLTIMTSTVAMAVSALTALTLCGAAVTTTTVFGDDITGFTEVVTGVTVDFSTGNAELVATIRAEAPTPGNYEAVSNAAMNAVQGGESFTNAVCGIVTNVSRNWSCELGTLTRRSDNLWRGLLKSLVSENEYMVELSYSSPYWTLEDDAANLHLGISVEGDEDSRELVFDLADDSTAATALGTNKIVLVRNSLLSDYARVEDLASLTNGLASASSLMTTNDVCNIVTRVNPLGWYVDVLDYKDREGYFDAGVSKVEYIQYTGEIAIYTGNNMCFLTVTNGAAWPSATAYAGPVRDSGDGVVFADIVLHNGNGRNALGLARLADLPPLTNGLVTASVTNGLASIDALMTTNEVCAIVTNETVVGMGEWAVTPSAYTTVLWARRDGASDAEWAIDAPGGYLWTGNTNFDATAISATDTSVSPPVAVNATRERLTRNTLGLARLSDLQRASRFRFAEVAQGDIAWHLVSQTFADDVVVRLASPPAWSGGAWTASFVQTEISTGDTYSETVTVLGSESASVLAFSLYDAFTADAVRVTVMNGVVVLAPFFNNTLDVSGISDASILAFAVSVSEAAASDVMRDLWFVVTAGAYAPTIAWPAGFSAADGKVASLAAFANATSVFHITEYLPGKFMVEKRTPGVDTGAAQ